LEEVEVEEEEEREEEKRERGTGKTFVDKSFPKPFQKTLTEEFFQVSNMTQFGMTLLISA